LSLLISLHEVKHFTKTKALIGHWADLGLSNVAFFFFFNKLPFLHLENEKMVPEEVQVLSSLIF
jgi:hypothetical protein